MAKTPSELNRKVLQHLRTTLGANAIGPHGSAEGRLKNAAALGEIIVQLGDAGSGNTGTSLWTLVNDGDVAVRFVNQAYVDGKVLEIAEATGHETQRVNNIIESVGLNPDGTLSANTFNDTRYLSALTQNTVIAALKELDDNIERIDNAVLDNLNVDSVNADPDKILVNLQQHDGLIGSATTKNVGELKITGYSDGEDAKLQPTDTLNAALGKLQGQINAMDKEADAVEGKVVTTVAEADGKVTETKANLTEIKLVGYEGDHGTVTSADTLGSAIDKIEDEIAEAVSAVTVASADKSITVRPAANGTDIAVNIKSGEKVLAKDGNAGLYTNIKLSAVTPTDAAVREEYVLLATDNSVLGDHIKIYKDSAYKEIYLGTSADTVDTTTGAVTKLEGDKESLNYVYMKADGTYEMVKVDLEQFLTESEFGNGLQVDGHLVSVKRDADSEQFLTVGPAGIKLDGVQDAINAAMASGKTEINTTVAGDATKTHMGISATTAADGHTVYEFGLYDVASQSQLEALSGSVLDLDATVSAETSHIDVTIVETDGKLTSVVLHEDDIASDSDLQALSGAVQQLVEGFDSEVSGNTAHIEVGVVQEDGKLKTLTLKETDIASASALTTEVNRATAAEKAIDDKIGSHTGETESKYDVEFSAPNNTVADKISNILKEIDAAKEALDIKVNDDNKYIATEVSKVASGTTIGISAITHDIATSTSAATGLADAYDVKQFAVSAVKDNASNGALTKIAIVKEDDVVKLDVSNLVVDCGTFGA